MNSAISKMRLAGLLAHVILLTACGGGDGAGGSTSNTGSTGNTQTNVAPNPAPPPNTTTVSQITTFWTFDTVEGASSPAIYAPGLQAELSSASTTSGKFGNALKFDATLPASYAKIQVLSLRGDISTYLSFPSTKIRIAMWVNPDSLSTNSTYHLFGNGFWGTKSFHVSLVNEKVHFDLFNPDNGNDDPIVSSQTAISAGVWTHIAVTYDGSVAKIYVNGNEDASNRISHAVPSVYNNLFIGGVGDGSTPLTFPGSIDELFLAASTFSASQVSQLVAGYRPDH